MKKICYLVTIPLTIRAFFIPQLKKLSELYDVSVICGHDEKLKDELGESIHYISIDIPRGVNLPKTIKTILTLRKQFKMEQYDLVQYSTPNAAFCASIAAKFAGIKVRNYHLMGLRYLGAHGIGRFILKKLEKVTCCFSTSIECVSKSNLEIGVKDKVFSRDKATVVWNGSTGGVNLQRFNINKRFEYRNEIRSQYGLNSDDYVFGFVGRITKDKGINEILEAFPKIEAAKLMMIGNVEAVETLNQDFYKQSLCNSNIIYTGNVSDVEKYFAALDVLLLPSYREGFGNVVIEAGAMGTPAIVSDIPGPVDAIIRNETAIVVKPFSEPDLYDAMRTVMKKNVTEMGCYAAKYVSESFDSEKLNKYILMRKTYLLGENNETKYEVIT